ncbi:MAG TPA: hypothetical protein VFN41_11610 [Candidatus Limnocylindrales bacterium]|nr:hypothetical protein [Candidatus Limnocylindrales bacterium]
MDDSRPTNDPGERRPTRPLDHAPSDRYRVTEAAEEDAAPSPPVARGIVFALLVAIAGGIAIAVAGGRLTITAGLLVIAAVLGWVVAVALAIGLGTNRSMGGPARGVTAAAIAVLGVALGQLGLWLIAREEGGVLAPADYLADVFGFLVPAEFALAAAVAWWRAR